ncbi:hypothetical protein PLCT2_00484 [Planctomycetaceae bacterium]|nr:hypothetical protein PLCT2_00484 [Planctomycetaceae bacterium]
MSTQKLSFSVSAAIISVVVIAGVLLVAANVLNWSNAPSKGDVFVVTQRGQLVDLSRDVASVRIVDRQIDDSDLESFLQKSDLEFLDITGCRKISNRALIMLPLHRHLRVLILSKTSVDSDVNAVLEKCTNVERLDLSWTGVQSLSGSTLAGMRNLEWLEASGCGIDRATLISCAQHPTLTRLSVRSVGSLGPRDFEVLAQSKTLAGC